MREINQNSINRSRLGWRYALSGMVVFSVVLIFVMVIVGAMASDEAQLTSLTSVFGIIQPLLLFIVGLLVIWLLKRKSYRNEDSGLVQPTHLQLLYGVAVGVIFSGITWLFLQIFPEAKEATTIAIVNQAIGENFVRDLMFVVTAVVCAPLGEELIFRGMIFRGIFDGMMQRKMLARTALAFIVAALISALLFAVTHVDEGQESHIVPMVLFGVMAAWLYWKTGSLYVSVVAHSVNNMLYVVSLATASNAMNVTFFVIALLAIGLAVFLLWVFQNFMRSVAIDKASEKMPINNRRV